MKVNDKNFETVLSFYRFEYEQYEGDSIEIQLDAIDTIALEIEGMNNARDIKSKIHEVCKRDTSGFCKKNLIYLLLQAVDEVDKAKSARALTFALNKRKKNISEYRKV